jgi:GTP-binding protein HflX
MTYTLTDTVGFVRHLPHQLVEAFRSTLEEVAEADLVVHVVDASDAMPERQVSAVREVLAEVVEERGEAMPPELLVVNKIDAADHFTLARLRNLLPGAVFVSARNGTGMTALRERIAASLPHPSVAVDVLLPYSRADLVARVHAEGEVTTKEHTEHGTRLRAKVYPDLAAALDRFVTDTSGRL